MRDTSQWGYTPSNFTMTQMVGLAVLVFMIAVAFMFWLGGIAANNRNKTPAKPTDYEGEAREEVP